MSRAATLRGSVGRMEQVLNTNRLDVHSSHLMATSTSRPLSSAEQQFVNEIWNRWHATHIDVYGPGNARKCLKLRRYKEINNRRGKHIANGPQMLTPGWIGFLHTRRVLPTGFGELSHQCGCKLCINGSTIVHEPKLINLERRECHRLIRRFEKAVRGTEDRVDGMVTVDVVGTLWEILSPCRHNPRCFVNFGCARSGKQSIYVRKIKK